MIEVSCDQIPRTCLRLCREWDGSCCISRLHAAKCRPPACWSSCALVRLHVQPTACIGVSPHFLDFLGLQVLHTEVVGRLWYAACVLNYPLIGLALQRRQFLLTLALTELQAWQNPKSQGIEAITHWKIVQGYKLETLSGCWQNDCKNSDKFIADTPALCARTCAELPECTHWTYLGCRLSLAQKDSFGVLVFSFWPRFGEQDGMKPSFLAGENESVEKSHESYQRWLVEKVEKTCLVMKQFWVQGAKKCFFRKSDGGRETLEGWSAGLVCWVRHHKQLVLPEIGLSLSNFRCKTYQTLTHLFFLACFTFRFLVCGAHR